MNEKGNNRQMWIAFDMFECAVEVTESREKAREIAEGYMEMYSEEALRGGWPYDFEKKVGYAKVIGANRKVNIEKKEDYDEDQWGYSNWDEICDFRLVPPEKIE